MTTFAQRIISDDRIAVAPDAVWAVLSDPDRLAGLTPLVDHIRVDGDRWRWQLVTVRGLGLEVALSLTTIMDISDTAIAFRPDPEADDRAGARGQLDVVGDGPDHTTVAIDLEASVDLPLPRLATRAVRGVMYPAMRTAGVRFATNLLHELGDPDHKGINVRRGEPQSAPADA